MHPDDPPIFMHSDDGIDGVVAWSQIIPGVITHGNNQHVSREINPPELEPGRIGISIIRSRIVTGGLPRLARMCL